jgi:hypothetical protein
MSERNYYEIGLKFLKMLKASREGSSINANDREAVINLGKGYQQRDEDWKEARITQKMREPKPKGQQQTFNFKNNPPSSDVSEGEKASARKSKILNRLTSANRSSRMSARADYVTARYARAAQAQADHTGKPVEYPVLFARVPGFGPNAIVGVASPGPKSGEEAPVTEPDTKTNWLRRYRNRTPKRDIRKKPPKPPDELADSIEILGNELIESFKKVCWGRRYDEATPEYGQPGYEAMMNLRAEKKRKGEGRGRKNRITPIGVERILKDLYNKTPLGKTWGITNYRSEKDRSRTTNELIPAVSINKHTRYRSKPGEKKNPRKGDNALWLSTNVSEPKKRNININLDKK